MKFFHDCLGGGAWPILVGVVKCLVDSDNERDHNMIIRCVEGELWDLLGYGVVWRA